MTAPLVSVIIPVGPGVCRQYSPGFGWLREAIASALGQTLPLRPGWPLGPDFFQIIVAVETGGGNDMGLLGGLPVEVVSSTAGAPGPTRNVAIALARGKWLAFLDADDLWSPDKTARQLAAVATAERLYPTAGVVAVVYSNARTIDAEGGELEPFMRWPGPVGCLAALVAGNRVPFSTAMIRRDVFERVGGFNAEMAIAEDYELWLRVAAARERFCYVPEALASYRVHPGQASADPLRMAQGVTQALRYAWLRSLRSAECRV
jgi:hypothetical protein